MRSPSLLLALPLLSAPALAQAGGGLAPGERAATVTALAEQLERHYVFPEKAEMMGVELRALLENGEFDADDAPDALARHLTRILHELVGDLHLRVRFTPGRNQRSDEDPLLLDLSEREDYRASHWGFQKLEVLDGNVGYLDLRGFAPVELARTTAIGAMHFLADCDAVIFDLRSNGGGTPQMVQLLCSYLFDRRTHLNSIHSRGGSRIEEFWTLDDLPGPRLADVPAFVLTSARTFSAAEEFTYNLKSLGRAVIVGETTGGGAHPGDTFALGERFSVFIAIERSVNPVTGTNWEGTGVAPDVACSASQALEQALSRARKAAAARRAAREEAGAARLAALRERLDQAQEDLAAGREAAGQRAARDALREGLASGLLDLDAVATLSRLALEQEHFALALVLATVLVEAFPEESLAHVVQARALEQAGDDARALAAYEAALALAPGDPEIGEALQRLRGGR